MNYINNLELQENEIIVSACAVKYHSIDYQDMYVTITQNRTRRRVYNGWYFKDIGTHIYVSTFCVDMFQHKSKLKQFIINTVTKEWRDFQSVIIERHKPEKKEPVNIVPYADLIR
jgi:hypothetical protein